MENQFWHNCWEKDHIGFHQDDLNPLLLEHFQPFIAGKSGDIFVPLCGKSLDMHYLARYAKILGAELSEKACSDFFKEADLDCHLVVDNRFRRYIGEQIELLAGDFFKLEPQDVKHCPVIYDRAALIALPIEMRRRYIDKLLGLYPGGGSLFLLSLEYPEGEIEGPPFAVMESEIQQLFRDCQIDRIKTVDLPDGKFARRTFKVSSLKEVLYIISW